MALNTNTGSAFGAGTSNFSFGTPATKSFGTGFSFGGATTTPAFGLGNTATTTSSTGFNFGGLTSTPSTSAGFAGFGATQPTLNTGTSTGFGTGFSGFGTPATSTGLSAPSFGFGTGTSTFGTGTGGFGAQPTSGSLFSGFGQPAANTGFGGGFPSFGTKSTFSTIQPGGIGSAIGGFGFGGGSFGQPTNIQPKPEEAVFNSVFNCSVFGDERDAILAKWNLIQALWGTGKGFYSQNAPPVEYNLHNPLCKFKAIGYSCIPTSENKEGLIALVINKKEAEVRAQQSLLINSLNTILGNKPAVANPNLLVVVEGIKPMSDSKSQVIFYVQERTAVGTTRRIPALELSTFLLNSVQKQQLTGLGVENLFPQMKPDLDQLKEFLETPPAGIDPRLWNQAQLDNPCPEKYIPVPVVGFEEVRWRMKCQEQETQLHQAFLDQMADEIAGLQRKHSATAAMITEYKRKLGELQHRILKVMVHQEVSRKVGLAFQPEEEVLKSQLEDLIKQLNAPTRYRGRLTELLSKMRMLRTGVSDNNLNNTFTLDESTQKDIKQFLQVEQLGMTHLIDVIQNDLGNLKVIKDGMLSILQKTAS